MRKPLYNGTTITLGLAVLMIMSFVLIHGLTSHALSDLLNLLTLLLPRDSIIPQTIYHFKRFLNYNNDIAYHLLCPHCSYLLGTGDNVKCLICNMTFNKKELMDKGSFFIYMSIKCQLERILRQDVITEHLVKDRNHSEDLSLRDMQDGIMYKKFLGGELSRTPLKNLSLSMNFDGATVFQS